MTSATKRVYSPQKAKCAVDYMSSGRSVDDQVTYWHLDERKLPLTVLILMVGCRSSANGGGQVFAARVAVFFVMRKVEERRALNTKTVSIRKT